MTWKGFAASMITVSLGLIAINRDSVSDLEAKIESRVSREEFVQHVSSQNRWQDRVEAKLEALSAAALDPAGDVNQAQYVLVKLPPSETELFHQTVRDVLIQQGKIDGTP